MGVRLAAAAGTFYPGERRRLAQTVDEHLAAAPWWSGMHPWGIVAPHAGYVYSGPVAASAYATVRAHVQDIARVVVFGPAHFVPLAGSAVPSTSAWQTPLGDVPIDAELRDAAIAAGCTVDDGAHEPEHSVEVQLPFLQRLIHDRLRLLPVAVGDTTTEEVVRVLDALDRLVDLVVVSTDLSHYEDIETARKLDRRTADAVLALDAEALGTWDACGVFALRGALAFARATSRRAHLLDLRTSGDTAGDPARVVGYGAFVFT